MSSRQLHCGSRGSQASQECPESPDDSDSLDMCLKERQQQLDHQRELLEKRQRRKRLDPMMVQPNAVTGLPLAKQRSGENRIHLRSSFTPGIDFILPGAIDPVDTTRPNDQDSVPELPTFPLNSSAGASSAIDAVGADLELPVSCQDSFVTIEDIDESNEELRFSKKFFNIQDVVGVDNKDLDLKRPASSRGSLTTVEKIEALEIMPCSPKLAYKKFDHKNSIAAQVIMECEEEYKEVIPPKPLRLSPVKKSEGAASLKSAAGSIESFETVLPEVNALWASLSNLEDFVYHQAPQDVAVRCMIIRDIKGTFPGYFMFVEARDNKEMFVLAARKYKKLLRSEYIISTDIIDLHRGGSNYVGRLRANLMKNKYILYNHSMAPKLCRNSAEKCSIQQELETITYKNKAFGFRRLKSMNVIIPSSAGSEEQASVESKSTFKNMFLKWRKKTKDRGIVLKNKNPFVNLNTQSYRLLKWMKKKTDKKFQIIQESEPPRVVMQLEHVIKNEYRMEYSYPLSAVQAFAIALSRFDRG